MSNPLLKYLFTAMVSSAVLCLDQATKIYIHTHIQGEKALTVIKGFFDIVYVRNAGGAFGLFSESHEILRFILFLFFPIVCIFLIFKILQESQNRFQILALAFILGGALGNYMDRLRLGYVVDFIDWYVKDWHWPTFNVADSFIVVGVSILFYFYMKEWIADKKS